MNDKTQIKSRERVKDLAEVYTRQKEVNAMLDLIPQKVYANPASRWLEPACGTGNFLESIIQRKMDAIGEDVLSDKENLDITLLEITANLYGIDINEENVIESRQRIADTVNLFRKTYTKNNSDKDLFEAIVRSLVPYTIFEADTLNPDSYRITGFDFHSDKKGYLSVKIFPLDFVMQKTSINNIEHSPVCIHYTEIIDMPSIVDEINSIGADKSTKDIDNILPLS